MCVLAVSAVAKVASADDQSPIIWGGVAAGLIILSLFLIPWPFIRVGIAWILAFAAMFTYKVVANR
jgi:hypothetical protein